MKIKNNKKNKPVIPVIVTIIITAIITTGLFQVFRYGPLKAKYTKAEKQLTEKETVIIDTRTLLEKISAEFNKFKLDTTGRFLEMKRTVKDLAENKYRLTAAIIKIYTLLDSFEGNFCDDENIIPDLIKLTGMTMAEAKK